MMTAWQKVMKNVELSAKNGSAGGRTVTLLRDAGYTDEEIYSKLGNGSAKEVTIDANYLEKLFKEQEKRCYWLGTLIEESDVFVPDHPLAPSVDRLNNDLGYVSGNVVITTRFANTGRRSVDDLVFINSCIPRIKKDIKFARTEMKHYNIKDTSGRLNV